VKNYVPYLATGETTPSFFGDFANKVAFLKPSVRQRQGAAGGQNMSYLGMVALRGTAWSEHRREGPVGKSGRNRCEGVMTALGSLSFLGREVWPAVSLYLPTGSSAGTRAQRMAQVDNVIGGAKAKLKAAGLERTDVQRLLGPVDALLTDPTLLERDQIHALDLAVGPRMLRLGEAVVDVAASTLAPPSPGSRAN
jgi:hypothetical protein